MVQRRVSLLLFAYVPVSSRCALLKLHLTLSLLVVACTFLTLTSHCRLTCIVRLVHSLPLSVMVHAPSPHLPSTDCHSGIIINSQCLSCVIVTATFNTNGLGQFKKRKDFLIFSTKFCYKKQTGKQRQRK